MKDIRLALRTGRLLLRRSRAFAIFIVLGVSIILLADGLVAQAARATHQQVFESTIMRTIEVDSHGVSRPIPLTQARIAELAALPGVRRVRPWIQSGCLVTESAIEVPGALWATPRMEVGQPPVIKAMREPLPPLDDDEVILPAHVQGADMEPLVGFKIVIEYTQRVAVDAGEPLYLELQVVGIYDEAIGGRDGPAAVYVNERTALRMAAAREGVTPETFGRTLGYPKVIVETRTAGDVPRLQREISNRGYNASSVQSQLEGLPPAMRLIELLGNAMGVLLLIVSLFAGLSIGAGLVAARLREIGLLKAIGFTNGRVSRLLGLELAIFGLAASFTGVAVGTGGRVLLQNLLGGRTPMTVPLAENITFPTISLVVLLALAPGASMILGGILPMVRAARLPPDLAMRDAG